MPFENPKSALQKSCCSNKIQALLDAYEDIFKFCKHARTVFVNNDGPPHSPQRTSMTTFFKVQWLPFEVQFGEIESSFQHHSMVLLHSTQAVGLESGLGVQSTLLDLQLQLRSCTPIFSFHLITMKLI